MVLFITGEVTEDSTKRFLDSIQDEPLEVHIDSVGGDLFEGLKIYNRLLNHSQEVNIIIDGVAGSIASVIALASDKRSIAETGTFMIHNALVPMASGNHHDLQKIANTLEQYSNIIAGVYADRTKLTHEEALQFMNNEQTFTAKDAVELGFATNIIEPLKAVAKINTIDMNLLDTIKSKLKNEVAVDVTPVAEEEVQNEMFSPEQLEEIKALVSAMIAEALAGNTEEVGATIATVLNSITSQGNVNQSAGITEATINQPVDGISAFHAKMKEIKNQNHKK